MVIQLGERTPETVKIYFLQSQQPIIKAVLPQKAQTVEEALKDYRATLLPGATSYGRTILVDGNYVGDVWCYGINLAQEPNAMLSYCIFDRAFWGRGIAARAIAMFLETAGAKLGLRTIGAFTYSDNLASISVLEKNGFCLAEEWTEDGRGSKYFQRGSLKHANESS